MIHNQESSEHPLRHTQEFSGFTDSEFQELRPHIRYRHYAKGQVLFNEEDPKHTLFYVAEGLVRLERYDSSGDYMYVDYVKQGRLFPYGDLFSGDTYHCTASILTNSEVYVIPFPLFESILSGNSSQLVQYYKTITKILKEHERRIQFLVVSSAQSRVIQGLSYLMMELGEEKDGSISIPYPLTINELAVLSGTSRETTGQLVQQLRKQEKIEYTHKRFLFKEIEFFKEQAR